MYHVAICDNDKMFVSYLKKIIRQARGENAYQLRIYEFYSGEALINSLDSNVNYDLLILDMELGGIDGDETARLFRMKLKNAVLVFCSGVHAPTVISFKATPFRYLLKSYSDVEFISEMKEILAEVARNTKESYIIGHYRTSLIKVKTRNIVLIENAKRGSEIIVCKNCEEAKFNGKILVDDKLSQIAKKYPEFVYAHRSYIINITHIAKIAGSGVYLNNGEFLSISRPYQKNFREIFTKSIADKYS